MGAGVGGSRSAIDATRWLRQTTAPGDLVLTGSRDPLSAMIQWGTRSRVSHAAIVSSSGTVVEAFDYGLTPHDRDEGVYENSFDHLVDRTRRLDRIVVRRPDPWPASGRAELDRRLAEAVESSPPFPTAGAALTCLLVLLTHPRVRGLTDRAGDRVTERVERVGDRLVWMVGDGPARVHCSEIATRLYTAAGVELRFVEPALGRLLFRVPAAKETDGGRLKIDRHHRQRLTALVAGRPPASPGQRPRPVKGAGSQVKVSTTWQATGGVLLASVSAVREQARTAGDHSPDIADLVLPADFERAQPFVTVGTLVRRGQRWTEVDD